MLVGCFSSQQHASVSQGRFCRDSCTCCHTEIEVADQTCYLTQSQYFHTAETTRSSTDEAWWSPQYQHLVTVMTRPGTKPGSTAGFDSRSAALETDTLPLGPGARFVLCRRRSEEAFEKGTVLTVAFPSLAIPPLVQTETVSQLCWPLTHSIPSSSQCLNVMRQYLSNKTTKQKDAHTKFGSLTKKL